MEFIPLYYTDKLNLTENGRGFNKDRLNIVNSHGYSGIVTLWTKPQTVWDQLLRKYPSLFDSSKSPLVVLSSLYGNGLPQMLSNLAYNPQIDRLAVTGKDTPAVRSFTYMDNFLKQGVKIDSDYGKISGTEFPIDPQLTPDLFKNLKVERFEENELEKLMNFITSTPTSSLIKLQRRKIDLIQPTFRDYPSNIIGQRIQSQTPSKAWMEILHRIDRYGKNMQLGKGLRRSLFDLKVYIDNPKQEPDDVLKNLGFDVDEIQAYKKSILNPELRAGETYNYGNRLLSHFGFNILDNVANRIKKDPFDRRAFGVTWDNKTDNLLSKESDSSVPCLTDLYFLNVNDSLLLTAGFRTHSAVSGWFMNVCGLRSIQEYVASASGVPAGKMVINSRWIAIDPEDARTKSALETMLKHRTSHLEVNDPLGYFVVEAKKDRIQVEHFSPNNALLHIYEGKTAKEIKDELRKNSAIDNPDHAIWLGYNLAKAHLKVNGEIPDF